MVGRHFLVKNSSEWPNQPVILPSLESHEEAKLEKTNCSKYIKIANAFGKKLEKYELQKALTVSAWENRSIKNCHHSKQSSPFTTSEIEKQSQFYIESEQKRLESSEKFQQNRKSRLSSKYKGNIWMQRQNSGKLSSLFTEGIIVNRKSYLGCT